MHKCYVLCANDIEASSGINQHEMNERELFFRHVAQTSPAPLALHIARAEGTRLFAINGKEYLDLIGGISVCNIGHCHPNVVEAIRNQAGQYLHLLVYGEFIQSPQVKYAAKLAAHLPQQLQSVYFTNSGTEATEGAMKLAKRFTGRTGIVAFNKSYHGSSQGALSIIGDEYWRNAFRPLLPGITHLEYNSMDNLDEIGNNTACVIAETVQAERGVYAPSPEWMFALRKKCDETGALLVLDEIQVGFGRTGTMWGFEQFNIIPDILLLGKALGGGLPLGAFISSSEIMSSLVENPVLGHITTFGGNPVCCAAGAAAMDVLMDKNLIDGVGYRAELFKKLLIHPGIIAVRTSGLLIAIEFQSATVNQKVIARCLELGLVTDWFLFAPHCLRIAPPLTISPDEIRRACGIILRSLAEIS